MDILFSTSDFGSKTTSYMPLVATGLADRGYAVEGVQYRGEVTLAEIPIRKVSVPTLRTPWWVGQWLRQKPFERELRTVVDRNRPAVIISGAFTLIPTVKVGESLDIPVVVVIPGLGFTRFSPLDIGLNKRPSLADLPWSARIQYPFVLSLFRQYRSALRRAADVVVLSEFLQDCIHETFGSESKVIRTPVPLDEMRAGEHPREYITMVNPRHRLKGADILARVAREMPNEKFLVAGEFPSDSIENELTSLDNLVHLGWVDDMVRVYEKTRLLLMPSRYEEGGPRTIVEAFANGIPAVGTDRGAIPEQINGGGEVVSDPDDIEEWKRGIRRVLGDYDRYSEQASAHAELFDAEGRLDEFERLVASHLDR